MTLGLAELLAAGHRWADLQDGYTVAQVRLFAEAQARRQQAAQVEQAEAVWLGIAAALNPKEKILQQLRQALAAPGQPNSRKAAALSPETAAFFGSAPVLTKPA